MDQDPAAQVHRKRYPFGRLPWLWALTLLPLALLAALPSTRWLLALQVQSLAQPPMADYALLRELGVRADVVYTARSPERTLRSHAGAHPDDYAAQMVAALANSSSERTAAGLRALQPRFPGHPGLYAHALRYASSRMSLGRQEETLMTSDVTFGGGVRSAPPSPDQLAEFDRDAAAGERLDPDNGFFPLMRAYGLLAAHRDAEAFTAIDRASNKSKWDDYAAEETRSRWQVRSAIYGREPALRKTVVRGSILYPHFARIRSVARVAVALAIQKEIAGRTEEGLAIRTMVARSGDRLRVDSPSLIGSLVGIAVTAIATSRPGGVLPPKRPQNLSVDAWIKQRHHAYEAYLVRIGHPEEAQRARAAFEAGRKVKEIARRGLERSPVAGKPIVTLTAYWAVGLIVLCLALWMLMIAVVSATLARVGARTANALMVYALGLFLLGALAFRLIQSTEALAMLVSVLDNLASDVDGSLGSLSPGAVRLLTAVAVVGLPILLMLLACVVAVIRRRDRAATIARVLTVAAFLFALVYAGIAISTALQEARISDGLERTINGEGKYLSVEGGREWPGPVY